MQLIPYLLESEENDFSITLFYLLKNWVAFLKIGSLKM